MEGVIRKSRRTEPEQVMPTSQRTTHGNNSGNSAFAPPLTVSHPALLVKGSDEPFRETLYVLVEALTRLSNCRDAFGKTAGLTGSQFAVLMGVAHRQGKEGVTIRDLARHVQLAPTHVTTEVGRLIRKGLMQKRPSPTDGRAVLVTLSRKGENIVQELSPFMRTVNDLLFEGFRQSDIEQIRMFFDRFVANSEFALAELRRRERQRSSSPIGSSSPDQ
jgi:DNA-binding MarR family transcriptional regulator